MTEQERTLELGRWHDKDHVADLDLDQFDAAGFKTMPTSSLASPSSSVPSERRGRTVPVALTGGGGGACAIRLRTAVTAECRVIRGAARL